MVADKKYWWGKKILFFIHPTFKVKDFLVECTPGLFPPYWPLLPVEGATMTWLR